MKCNATFGSANPSGVVGKVPLPTLLLACRDRCTIGRSDGKRRYLLIHSLTMLLTVGNGM